VSIVRYREPGQEVVRVARSEGAARGRFRRVARKHRWLHPTLGGNQARQVIFCCMMLGYADINQNGTLNKSAEKSGLCIMTNSCYGDSVYHKLFHTILFLKKWSRLPNILDFVATSIPFYVPDGKISEKWTHWRGKWGGGVWHIDEHDGNVCVVFRSLPPVQLLPVSIQEEGDVWLRLEGLEKLFHFVHEQGEKGWGFRANCYSETVRMKMRLDFDKAILSGTKRT
jgi:hypothetical protein